MVSRIFSISFNFTRVFHIRYGVLIKILLSHVFVITVVCSDQNHVTLTLLYTYFSIFKCTVLWSNVVAWLLSINIFLMCISLNCSFLVVAATFSHILCTKRVWCSWRNLCLIFSGNTGKWRLAVPCAQKRDLKMSLYDCIFLFSLINAIERKTSPK